MKSHLKKNDLVVYPSHGVGKIINIYTEKLGTMSLELYKIFFEKEAMTLSVPVARAEKIGLRRLCSVELIDEAVAIISEVAQTTRGVMWSRRAQEYERKINSGDVLAIAEVIRDLHRNIKNPDRSYSERLIYESAYNRFVLEASYVKKITIEKISDLLKVEEEDDDDNDNDDDNNNNGGGDVMVA